MKTEVRVCINCNVEFVIPTRYLKRGGGNGRFCSQSCSSTFNNISKRGKYKNTHREEAKTLNNSTFIDNEICGAGHISPKYTSSGKCVDCVKINNTAYNATEKGKLKKRSLMRRYTPYRKAQLLNRIPVWLDCIDVHNINFMYKFCPEGYHVDHVIPLQGKEVSGLHMFENLQWLSSRDNIVKHNKFEYY